MSQGGYVTLVGFVAQDPRLRETNTGKHVTVVRVGATPRVLDKTTGQWHDKETSYYTVNCWQRLADHVQASLRKGDPVVVKGRFKTHSWEDRTGHLRTQIEIEAETVGHDLSRGVANYLRHRPRSSDTESDATRDQNAGFPEHDEDAGTPGDVFDADAIGQFGRDLDEGELAARALAEDADDDQDDEYETAAQSTKSTAPPVPSVPF
jgi:single-strand DNA-binding protein